MKKVMAFGTFDILHEGHKNFFKQARKYGDYLVVIIARDKTVGKVKGSLPRNNEKKRLEEVKRSGLVDKVYLGELGDKYKKILEIKPDVICLGYDQKYFIEGLNDLKIKIIKLKPFKPEVYKSSKMKPIN